MEPRRKRTRKSEEEDSGLNKKKPALDKEQQKTSSSKSDSNSQETDDCSICLDTFTNKSVTIPCFHKFCFTCIEDWTKVKPECPLCKQNFTQIIHNIKNDWSYEVHHINSNRRSRFQQPATVTELLWNICETFEWLPDNEVRSRRNFLDSRLPSILTNSLASSTLSMQNYLDSRLPSILTNSLASSTRSMQNYLDSRLPSILTNSLASSTLSMGDYLNVGLPSTLSDSFASSTLSMGDYNSHSIYPTPNSLHLGPDNEVRSRNPSTPRMNNYRSQITESRNLQNSSLKKIPTRKNAEQVPPNLNPGPSTSNFLDGRLPSTLPDSEDDEIQVLQVILPNREKTPEKKTPEIVDLSSDEEN